jgi:parvulin-like peptidyl-prolyl isomerase
MQRKSKLTPRIALAILFVLYLLGDLLVFNGPLRHQFNLLDPNSSTSIVNANSRGIVARVFNQPITHSQLERAVSERLWLAGKSSDSATPADHQAALDELIDHELLRATIKMETAQPTVSQQEIDERVRRLVGRFETKGNLEKAMKSQGIHDEMALKNRLAARIQQEKYIIGKITTTTAITDEDMREWYMKNIKHLEHPERVEARHIFIPTLGRPQEETKRQLEEALTKLTENQLDFATLAKEISQDPTTRDIGGNLGWMTRSRIPVDLAAPMFSLKIGKPTLIRSRLGWHLVEITARQPAARREFEDAKSEIIAALEAVRRGRAIAEFRSHLRNQEATNITIFNHQAVPKNQ